MSTDELRCPRCNVTVDEHPANRCLDVWVAEAVIGWRKTSPLWCAYPPSFVGEMEEYRWPARLGVQPVPKYSTSIAEAWEVVERLEKLGFIWNMTAGEINLLRPEWVTSDLARSVPCISGKAERTPWAICRVALKAVGHG